MNITIVGSSDVDLFISPKSTNTFIENENTISFNLGDKVPVDMKAMTLGGNGANVSVGLRRLGLNVTFYTYLGKDVLSSHIQDTIKNEGVNLIANEGSEKTAFSIILDFKKDRVIFSHHEEAEHTVDIEKISNSNALYLTSIGEKWESAYQSIIDLVYSKNIKLAFSPGSPQLVNLTDKVYEVLACSEVLFVNKEEGEKILEKNGQSAADMKDLLLKLSKLGPKIISLTDGKNGAYAWSEGVCYVVSTFNEEETSVDKTGAGDSYASAFFAGLLLNKDIKTCMTWGSINASSVMNFVGAQEGLLTQEEVTKKINARPDFTVEML